MKRIAGVTPWIVAVGLAAYSSATAEDASTLQKELDIFEKHVQTLESQMTALRQVVVISGADVEVKAAGTLKLSGAILQATGVGNLALKGGVIVLNGGSQPLLRGTGLICTAAVGTGGGVVNCIPNPAALSLTVMVP